MAFLFCSLEKARMIQIQSVHGGTQQAKFIQGFRKPYVYMSMFLRDVS